MLNKCVQPVLATLLSIIFVGSLSAQKVASTATAKSLLWEISGKDIKTSYVYGTIHLIPKSDFNFDDATKKAFDAAQRIVFEIDLKTMENPMALFGMMGKLMMPNDTTIKDLLTDADYKLLKNRFDSIGMPLEMLQSIKPMFLSMMLEGDGAKMGGMGAETPDKSNSTACEIEFYNKAKSADKPTGGLETMDFQIGLFDSIPLKVQAEMLTAALKTKDSSKDEYKDMLKMYLDKDVERMSSILKDEKSSTGNMAQYETMLLTNRNNNWIPKMEIMMREKSNFFAVGAGHLGGAKGVLQLLRAKGYTVKPLQVKA